MAGIRDIVDFGDTDAEGGFRPEYFVASSTWRKLRHGDRPLVLGRKGTGKTALRAGLRSEADVTPTLFVSELSFRDYPWNAHNAVFDVHVGPRSRYVESWRFLMLV